MSMITGIHHVQLTIPIGAEREAKAFYCEFLGLREIEKPESLKGRGGFWLQVGDRSVHVGAEDDVERQKTKAHIAYAVTDLGHWKEALRVPRPVRQSGRDDSSTLTKGSIHCGCSLCRSSRNTEQASHLLPFGRIGVAAMMLMNECPVRVYAEAPLCAV